MHLKINLALKDTKYNFNMKTKFLIMLFLPIVIWGQNNDNDSKKIESRIWAFLNANKNTLLGKNNNGLKKDSLDVYSDLQKELLKLESDNEKILTDFKTNSIGYKNGKIISVEYISKNINLNSAQFLVNTIYKFNFNQKVGAPEFTEYNEVRVFNFVKDKNRWVLNSQKILVNGLKQNNSETEDNKNVIKDSPARISLNDSKNNFDIKTSIAQNNYVPASGGPSFSNDFQPVYYYNQIAAANYALKYALSSNSSSYRTYTNDCTNFISQCLTAGGWTETGSTLNRTQSDVWFYNSLGESLTSYTWAGANNHYQFHKVSARSTMGTSTGQLRLGDILQVDFEGDGIVDHTVVVSKEDSTGADYVSYHTTNTLNKPLSQFISACGTTAKFYVWLVKRS